MSFQIQKCLSICLILALSYVSLSSLCYGKSNSSQLIALGYDEAIASKLVRFRPQLAQQILNFSSEEWARIRSLERANDSYEKLKIYGEKTRGPIEDIQHLAQPITLYRGLRIPPSKFDPNKFDSKYGDISYFSEDITIALNNALSDDLHPDAKFQEFTVIEIQMPRFLVYDGWPSNNARECPIVFRQDIQNLSPFIRRIGTADKKDGRANQLATKYSEDFLNSIHWRPFNVYFSLKQVLNVVHTTCTKLLQKAELP